MNHPIKHAVDLAGAQSFSTRLYAVADHLVIQNRPCYAFFKRVIDISLSALALIILFPVALIIAVLVKVTSPGPVFYKQARMTQYEKTFDIIKFRTMERSAEAKTGPTWVKEGDIRITKLGYILRMSHLDEIPQLWNVLKGDMSLVGPRPERPVFVEQFKSQGIPNYTYRHAVKAGITGHAQLMAPNPTMDDIGQKTQADLWYVQNCSLVLDIQLLWRTGLFFLSSLCQLVLKKLH